MLDEVKELKGMPRIISQLSEAIAAGLPEAEAESFNKQIAASILAEIDLSQVWFKFAIWTMHEMKKISPKMEDISTVKALYERRLVGSAVSLDEWQDAADETAKQYGYGASPPVSNAAEVDAALAYANFADTLGYAESTAKAAYAAAAGHADATIASAAYAYAHKHRKQFPIQQGKFAFRLKAKEALLQILKEQSS